MLEIVTSAEPWLITALQSIFDETAENHGNDYENISRFLQQDGGLICFWKVGNEYVSTCRVDIDGSIGLLHNLATKAGLRRKGYAKCLIIAIVDYLAARNVKTLQVHIKKDNIPSMNLHESNGFVKVKDTARLLDGTVTSAYITMEYQVNEKTR